jgi:hypothetical protein
MEESEMGKEKGKVMRMKLMIGKKVKMRMPKVKEMRELIDG